MTTLEQAAQAAAERAGYRWETMSKEYSPNYLGPQHDIRHARRWWIDNQRAAFERVREPSAAAERRRIHDAILASARSVEADKMDWTAHQVDTALKNLIYLTMTPEEQKAARAVGGYDWQKIDAILTEGET